MSMAIRTVALLTILVFAVPAGEATAQERRDTMRRAGATSAEEMHRIRRAWLEQSRRGQTDGPPPVYGSAVVGAPRSGDARGQARGQTAGGRVTRGDDLRGDGGLPYPAYPFFGRFADRFDESALARGRASGSPLLYGVQEYETGWYGPRRTYPGSIGWSDGAYGWHTASPWSSSPSDCVEVVLLMANGFEHRLPIGLQSLGLADPRDFDLAIDKRLSEGRPVVLQGLDGRVLRIDPGSAIDDIFLRPCGG